MKLEYLDNINEKGKYKDQLIRLYDFDHLQANEFRQAIQQTILTYNQSFNLSDLKFVEEVNCNLILRLSTTDIGITSIDKEKFYCDLSLNGYENMLTLLEPFCFKETTGYQWLYDLNNDIEFLFSPEGQW